MEYTLFSRNKAQRDGYRNECKPCAQSIKKANYIPKPRKPRKKMSVEEKRERVATWRAKNRDKIRQAVRDRYANDPEYRAKCLQDAKDRHKRNRSLLLARKHNRKARVLKAHDGTVDNRAIRAVLSERSCCLYCGKGITEASASIDHMNPISKGGAHSVHNLVACCLRCNKRKHDKPFAEWVSTLPVMYRIRAQRVYTRKQGVVAEQERFGFVY